MKPEFKEKYTLMPANPGWFVLHFNGTNQTDARCQPRFIKEEVICWAIDEAGERFPISYVKNYAGVNNTLYVSTPSGGVLSSDGSKWKNIEDWLKIESSIQVRSENFLTC